MVRNGQSWQGNPHLPASYFAYGQPLMAVADAVVIEASDGLPDNPPGHGADFHPQCRSQSTMWAAIMSCSI
jgi:hypothetical protein